MIPIEVKVPNLGDYEDVPVIEVHVKPGEEVKAEQALITLESDKATLDVPSPNEGRISDVRIKVGDRVSEGTVLVILEPAASPAATPGGPSAPAPAPALVAISAPPRPLSLVPPAPLPTTEKKPELAVRGEAAEKAEQVAHASPSVRKFARELGVELKGLEGSGPRGRILREDVQRFVKEAVRRPRGGLGLDLAAWPQVDFAKFGPVETRPVARIRRLSAANLARNWVMIPHVTQHDEADITDLEDFRQKLAKEAERSGGPKVTLLAFLVRACVAALKKYPEMNASLMGDTLVLKKYFHIGFAADTPNGLMVPVLRSADQKGILQIAAEAAELARRAREGKLASADMQGGTFSVSSLGGIGGGYFTPIINAPEVGILGVSRAVKKPVYDGAELRPRLLLPLSLSYDHRVIDGAAAARFVTHLVTLLADMRRAML